MATGRRTGYAPESVLPTPQAVSTSHPQPPPLLSFAYEQQGDYQATQEPFYTVHSSKVAKKNTRASQACEQCRQLKAKCDETNPCKSCKDKGTECTYRDPVINATDKAQTDILKGISAMQSTLSVLTDHFGHMDESLTKMEAVFSRNANAFVKRDRSHDGEFKTAPGSPLATEGQSVTRSFVDTSRNQAVVSIKPIAMATMVEDVMQAEPEPPVPPGEPAISINHTTGLLLEWEPIRELTKNHLEREGIRYIAEYPLREEQSRGLLRVYGRGEDSHLMRHSRNAAHFGTIDMAGDMSNVASSSPAADWGQLGGLSPSEQVESPGGVLASDGSPDFTESKIASYAESFKTNILNMHPIIEPKVLDEWVRHFLDELPTVSPKSQRKALKSQKAQKKQQVSNPAFAVSQNAAEGTGSKRKRSSKLQCLPSTPAPVKVGKPNRSIHSALVLVIIALGKVCLHRENVPDVIFSSNPIPNGSPVTHNEFPPSPTQGPHPGFSSHPQSSGLPSPKEQERGFRSTSSISRYNLKNYEVIPGLEYFALATEILGNRTRAYHDMDVYANIFAGLYYGQLARPLESFSFIHQASHKLQVIMRPLDKLRKIKCNAELIQQPEDNQIALAFWTCLQLESDLIAELPLPPSGILRYEDDMPRPNMNLLQGFDQRILDSYLGQLYLLTHLNRINRTFYCPDASKSGSKQFKNVEAVEVAVSGNWAPPSFVFGEDDAPAGDILAARLRAKYWGAQVITYRPFVMRMLQWSFEIRRFRSGIPIHPDTKPPDNFDIARAKKGIKAMIESTRAFQGLGDKRPVITDVFGTAHAQWGNLLVLSAAFKYTSLRKLVDEKLLRNLFHKTIAFLRQSATRTSSLAIDMRILEGLQSDLFSNAEVRSNPFPSSSMPLIKQEEDGRRIRRRVR